MLKTRFEREIAVCVVWIRNSGARIVVPWIVWSGGK